MRTNHLSFLLLTLGLVIFAQCARQVAVEPVIDPAVCGRLAVLPFETESIFSTIGHQIADEVVVELIEKALDFHIVERARIDALLLEHDLENRGISAGTSALDAARLLGVDAIITGSVSLSIDDIVATPGRKERRAHGIAVVRLIDARDGRVIWAKRVESDYSMLTSLYGDVYIGQTDHELVQEVVQDLAHLIARYFYPHMERT